MNVSSRLDGTRLEVVSTGPQGAPTVVLVHGLGLSWSSWGRVPELLAGGHRVVAYDLRGHGASDHAVSGDYSLDAHAHDLGSVLADATDDSTAVLVAGHSLGGGIVLAHAAQGADPRLAGAVLVGSSGSEISLPGLRPAALPEPARRTVRLVWLALLLAAARLGRWLRPVRTVTNALARATVFTADAADAEVDQAREDFLATDPRVLARTMLASLSDDHTRLAPALRVPTLVVHGERDRQVTTAKVEELVGALPDARLVSLDGGHMLPLTNPEAVADQIARWSARVLGGRPAGDVITDGQETA